MNEQTKTYLRAATSTPMGLVQLFTLRQGLQMEVRTQGRMTLTRGPKCTTRVRRLMGLRGSRESLLEQVSRIYEIAQRYRQLLPRWMGADEHERIKVEAEHGEVWVYRNELWFKAESGPYLLSNEVEAVGPELWKYKDRSGLEAEGTLVEMAENLLGVI